MSCIANSDCAGENRTSVFCQGELRQSHDWINNKWNRLEERMDIADSLFSDTMINTKDLSDSEQFTKGNTLKKLMAAAYQLTWYKMRTFQVEIHRAMGRQAYWTLPKTPISISSDGRENEEGSKQKMVLLTRNNTLKLAAVAVKMRRSPMPVGALCYPNH